LLDGPLFIYSDTGEDSMMKTAYLAIDNGTVSDQMEINFMVDKPIMRARYKKISMIKFDSKFYPIDNFIQINGPFYKSQISPIPKPTLNKNLAKLVENKATAVPDFDSKSLYIETFNFVKAYSLDAEVRFYLDNMSVDYN
jgi:hypothetical protein